MSAQAVRVSCFEGRLGGEPLRFDLIGSEAIAAHGAEAVHAAVAALLGIPAG